MATTAGYNSNPQQYPASTTNSQFAGHSNSNLNDTYNSVRESKKDVNSSYHTQDMSQGVLVTS